MQVLRGQLQRQQELDRALAVSAMKGAVRDVAVRNPGG
jgi:hypothetical protein